MIAETEALLYRFPTFKPVWATSHKGQLEFRKRVVSLFSDALPCISYNNSLILYTKTASNNNNNINWLFAIQSGLVGSTTLSSYWSPTLKITLKILKVLTPQTTVGSTDDSPPEANDQCRWGHVFPDNAWVGVVCHRNIGRRLWWQQNHKFDWELLKMIRREWKVRSTVKKSNLSSTSYIITSLSIWLYIIIIYISCRRILFP